MLRRLTLGFFLLACTAAIAACSSNTTTPSNGGVPGSGPNFVKDTIYVANTTEQVIDIFTPAPGPSATPIYTIGGTSTTLSGPQYMAFNTAKQLFVTNYNPAQNTASILTFQTFATGNVLPLGTQPLAGTVHPRGIAFMPKDTGYVVAATIPNGFYTDVVQIYNPSFGLSDSISGSNTQLSVPVGVAVDAQSNIYVSNSGTGPGASGRSITIYTTPSPAPTPSGSPSPTPSPTATPTANPSASPSPSPAPAADNRAPVTTIQGASTGLISPMGIALDAAGNLYVADAGSSTIAARILVFNAPFGTGLQNLAPSRTIVSQNPSFIDPTDVKLDSAGNIYVVDAGNPNTGSRLLIFSTNASGTVTPTSAITLPPGTATGTALSP